MQKINLIAQGILELSHREKSGRQQQQQRRRQRRRHPSGLNYSPRRNVFRRGQKERIAHLGQESRDLSYFHRIQLDDVYGGMFR